MTIRLFRSFLFLSGAISLYGQTATAPVTAIVLDARGQLLSVTGVLQSLLPGVPFGSYGQVISASFGAAGGAIKTDSQLLVLDSAGRLQSQSAAPPGPALFGLDPDGNVGWVYFVGTSKLQNLDATSAFDASALGDEVLALGGSNSAGLAVLARTGAQLWALTVAPDTGATLSQTPITGGAPAAYFEGGWLVATPTGLSWGALTFTTPAPALTLQTAGAHSVAINGQWLLNSAWKILEIPTIPRSYRRPERASPIGARH